MEFTEQEIMFFTSVSHGRKPLGVTLSRPVAEGREQYIESTIQSLTKKGFINADGKLTRDGMEMLYFWEQYRNSKKHIAYNSTFAAPISEKALFAVTSTVKGYDVCFVMPEYIMLNLLKESAYLCMGEEKPGRGKWENLDVIEWLDRINDMDGSILLREYDYGKQMNEIVYCWTKEEGYLLNLSRRRMRNLSSAVMRKQIYTMLGGRKNG